MACFVENFVVIISLTLFPSLVLCLFYSGHLISIALADLSAVPAL